MKKHITVISVVILILSLVSCGSSAPPSEPAAPETAAPAKNPYFDGDGGTGKSIAIISPVSVGFPDNMKHIPVLVQGEFVSNFSSFTAMNVMDRERLDQQYAELLSGYYADDDQAGRDLGQLPSTDYLMGGRITRTNTGYNMQVSITSNASKMTVASASINCTFAELDNLSAIRKASLELLEKMGIKPTERARTELTQAAQSSHVSAQTTLAQGITSNRQGTVVEALSYYIQSTNYDPGLFEAASRLNILTANVTSGNIGENVRNDLQWRDQWVARLKEVEQYYVKYLTSEPPPYYIVYSTDIKQGEINYEKRTVPLSIEISAYPDYPWFSTLDQVVQTVEKGFIATGRAKTWGLDEWPKESLSAPGIFYPRGSYYGPLQHITGMIVEAEILDSNGKSIARGNVFLCSGWEVFQERGSYGKEYYDFKNYARPIRSTRTMVFPDVDPNAITDNLNIRITRIDGVPVETRAKDRRLSIMTAADYNRLPSNTRAARDISNFEEYKDHLEFSVNRGYRMFVVNLGADFSRSDYDYTTYGFIFYPYFAKALPKFAYPAYYITIGANVNDTGIKSGFGDFYNKNGKKAGFYWRYSAYEWGPEKMTVDGWRYSPW